MNDTEREAIILNSAWEMIDGMVNWAVFMKTDRADPSNLMFQTSGHARLFVILLGDFLSEIRAFKGGADTAWPQAGAEQRTPVRPDILVSSAAGLRRSAARSRHGRPIEDKLHLHGDQGGRCWPGTTVGKIATFSQIMFEKPLVARKHENDLFNHVQSC
ncbi:hypothetical protein [Mesorhizobium sp. M0520]|uniref:hypothetical protein n=1 Tax=Mesorhizobium sp. M0520 TaxID=2956957 RepID=UPI00333B1A0A